MRLTAMIDYALRLLMYVAQRPDRLCTIAEIAQAHGIPETHLMKVTHQLGIETVRGKGGGLRLARRPDDINLGALVRGVEPNFRLVDCFGTDSTCAPTGRCGLAGLPDGALQRFLAHLDGFTLADALQTARATRADSIPVRVHHRALS